MGNYPYTSRFKAIEAPIYTLLDFFQWEVGGMGETSLEV
jgi:hypothetical protein